MKINYSALEKRKKGESTMDKLELKMINISEGYGDWLIDSDTIDLEFNYDGDGVCLYKTPYEKDYLLFYKTSGDQTDEEGKTNPSMIWIENYQGLEAYIDKPDALPDVNFELFDDKYNEILEENISLRDFMKKYIFEKNIVFDGNIIDEVNRKLYED